MKRELKNKFYSTGSFMAYVVLLFFFVRKYIQSGIFDFHINSLSEKLSISATASEKIILNFSIIVTLISTLVEYGIASFLLLIFVSNSKKIRIQDVLIPKVILLLFNLFCLEVLKINSVLWYSYTAFLGVLLIFISSQYRQVKIATSFLFTAPFLVDALISLVKTYGS